jgi:hypothetical protein
MTTETPVLDLLRSERVLEVCRTDEGEFCFTEKCDQWFHAVLTKEQVLELAEELRAMVST